VILFLRISITKGKIYMITVLMFIANLICFQAALVSYKTFSKISADKQHTAPSFMAFWTGILGLIMALAVIIVNGRYAPSSTTVIIGIIGGLCFASAGIMAIYMMSTGPFIWSVLIMNLSNFLPVVFALIFLGESVSPIQVIGILMILSILAIMNIGSKDDGKPFTKQWMIIAVITMFVNGAIMSAQKAQSTFLHGEETLEMMSILFLSASVCAGIITIFALKGKEKPQLKTFLPPAFGLIASLGAGNLFAMTLMNRVSAAIQFPVIVGCGIIISSVISVVLYKEKPDRRLYISSALLICGIILLGT